MATCIKKLGNGMHVGGLLLTAGLLARNLRLIVTAADVKGNLAIDYATPRCVGPPGPFLICESCLRYHQPWHWHNLLTNIFLICQDSVRFFVHMGYASGDW